MASNINRPLGVSILAILGYIGVVLHVLAAIALFFGASFITSMLSQVGPFSTVTGGVAIFAGIIMLLFAALTFFISKGLWTGQNWARIIVIIFAALGVIFGIISLFTGNFSSIISILIDGIIAYYLWYAKEVVSFFS